MSLEASPAGLFLCFYVHSITELACSDVQQHDPIFPTNHYSNSPPPQMGRRGGGRVCLSAEFQGSTFLSSIIKQGQY